MEDQDFNQKLGELMEQIDQLPGPARTYLTDLAEETRQRHAKMKQTLGSLQESLDYLRLSTKYLIFDLEATRRENRYLRRLLESQSRGD